MKSFFRTLAIAAVCIASALSANAVLPSVQLKDMNGKPVDTATLSNDGKPMIISFWATWCKPCIRELKAIHEYYADWQDETGVKVIAVSIDEAQNVAKVKPLVDSKEWDYEVLLDPNSDFKRALGVQNPPHVFVVDGEGNIVFQHAGYTDGSEQELIEKVRELVNK